MVGHRCAAYDCRLLWMAGLLVPMACATDRADSLQERVATLEAAIRAEPRSAQNHFLLGAVAFELGLPGNELVLALVASDKQVGIADWGDGPKYNRAIASIWRDATNGVGTDADVYFHRDDSPIPTVQPNGRVIEQMGSPPYICLGHELIHALHMVRGTLIGIPLDSGSLRTIKRKLTYRDGSGKKQTIPQDEEELRTIGLGEYRDGITENALRREHDLPLRGAHGFGKKK